tara:strand:- start:10101 stop:10610 length:510 start_codon:yes stop_codon:yes gene_type:complete
MVGMGEGFSLDQKATQTSFAQLVGCSKQAIQKHAQRIGLPRDGSLGEWLKLYCDHLRSEAGRQGGESASDLAKQRVLESQQKTLAMSLENMTRLGHLVSTEQMSEAFNEFASAVPISINSAAENILSGIESKHAITVDDELVRGPLRIAAERMAGLARKLGERIRTDRG